MNDDKKVLGRGLASLISDETMMMLRNSASNNNDDHASQDVILNIPIDHLVPNLNQPRQKINDGLLKDLANSISQHGILQPVLVTKIDLNKYQIIAGERRWRAAIQANLEKIPVIIKNADQGTLSEIAIIENMQRENLKPIEEARAYKRLIDDFGYTQKHLSSRLGKSRTYITNMLRLLKLPYTLHVMIDNNELSAGHARALINSKDPEKFAEKIIKKKLTVRETERMVHDRKHADPHIADIKQSVQLKAFKELLQEQINKREVDPDIQQIEETMSFKLDADVNILESEQNHYLVIKTDDIEILDKILALLNK